MKKIIASKLWLAILMFWIVIFFTLAIASLSLEVLGFAEEKGAGFLGFFILSGLTALFLWFLNRMACLVWAENGIVKRRGLFCGFYKECRIETIQCVKIRHLVRDGDFICLIDNSLHRFDRTRKDSYICFKKNRKNLNLLNTFWHGSIEDS